MGQLYVLKLRGGKWYIGHTTRGIERILDHMDNKGAKWTKEFKPIKPIPYRQTEPGQTKAHSKNKANNDEDRLTLEYMKKYGIKNVRGGSWCMVKMRKKTHREIQGLIGKKKSEKPKAKDKPKPKKREVTCGRCGRAGHIRTNCKLKTTVDGVRITTKSWKYRPKAKPKAKPKPKKKSRKKPDYGVICARCNRQGHESKDCRAKTKVSPSGPLADILRKGLPKR